MRTGNIKILFLVEARPNWRTTEKMKKRKKKARDVAEKHGSVSFRRLLKTWVSWFYVVVKKHASLSSRR